MNEEYIIIDGIKIRRLVSGHGPPILLVHGLGEFLEIWISNIAGLSQKFTVYAMDLPGHGLSEKTREDYTLGFSVNFIAKFMKAAGLHKVNLVGHSLGGAICVGFTMNFPDKVDNLILVSSGGFTDEIPLSYRLVRLPFLANILLGPTFLVNRATIGVGVKRQFYNPDTAPEDWFEIVSRHLKKPERKATIRNIIKSNTNIPDMESRITNSNMYPLVEQPTLIVHGMQDKLTPVEHALNANNMIPHATLRVFDECGHHPQIEKAQEFNDLVLSLLKSS